MATKLLISMALFCLLLGSIFAAPRPNVVFASVGPAPITNTQPINTRPAKSPKTSSATTPNLFKSLAQAILQIG